MLPISSRRENTAFAGRDDITITQHHNIRVVVSTTNKHVKKHVELKWSHQRAALPQVVAVWTIASRCWDLLRRWSWIKDHLSWSLRFQWSFGARWFLHLAGSQTKFRSGRGQGRRFAFALSTALYLWRDALVKAVTCSESRGSEPRNDSDVRRVLSYAMESPCLGSWSGCCTWQPQLCGGSTAENTTLA